MNTHNSKNGTTWDTTVKAGDPISDHGFNFFIRDIKPLNFM